MVTSSFIWRWTDVIYSKSACAKYRMPCSYIQTEVDIFYSKKREVDMSSTSWRWITCKTNRQRCFQSEASLRQIQASNCMRVALPITNYGVHMYRMSNEPHNLYRKNIRTWAVRIVLGRNTMPFCIQYVTLSQISSTQYGLKRIECAVFACLCIARSCLI